MATKKLKPSPARPSTIGVYQTFTYKKQRWNKYIYVTQAMAFQPTRHPVSTKIILKNLVNGEPVHSTFQWPLWEDLKKLVE